MHTASLILKSERVGDFCKNVIIMLGHEHKLAEEGCESRWQLRVSEKQERVNDWEISKRIKHFSPKYYRKITRGITRGAGQCGQRSGCLK